VPVYCRCTPAEPRPSFRNPRLVDDQYAVVSAEVVEDVDADVVANIIGVPASG